MYVIPKPGLAFRDPHTRVRVPQEGMHVPDGSLEWARIIADGDAAEGPPPGDESGADPKTKAKASAGAADEAKA